MSKSEISKLDRLIKKLDDARDIADELGITVGNGGEVGGLVGSILDELQVRRAAMEPE